VSPVRYELGFYIPEDGIPHSHRHEKLKSYIMIEVGQFFVFPHLPEFSSCVGSVLLSTQQFTYLVSHQPPFFTDFHCCSYVNCLHLAAPSCAHFRLKHKVKVTYGPYAPTSTPTTRKRSVAAWAGGPVCIIWTIISVPVGVEPG
jgi:hypothetical protein